MVRYQTALLGRQSDETGDGSCFHDEILFYLLLSALVLLFLLLLCLPVSHVAPERPGRCKFTKFVAHHVFGHEDRNVLLAIVDSDC